MLEVQSKSLHQYSLQVANKIERPRVVKTFLGAHLIPAEFKEDREKYVRQVKN